MSGRDKGMQGTVLEVLRSQNQVVVENCKMVRGNYGRHNGGVCVCVCGVYGRDGRDGNCGSSGGWGRR